MFYSIYLKHVQEHLRDTLEDIPGNGEESNVLADNGLEFTKRLVTVFTVR